MDLVDNEAAADPENPVPDPSAKPFHRYQQHVRDAISSWQTTNDFRGYEPSNDVSFECGMGYQLGKKLFGYMRDTTPCRSASPNYGESRGVPG